MELEIGGDAIVNLVDLIVCRLEVWIPVVLALTVHEWAHARAALALGDDTAFHLGRVSFDPLVHLDWVGTVALPLLGIPIGWAKPVPVQPTRFRQDINMSVGMLLVAGAGPFSNLVLAAVAIPLVKSGAFLGNFETVHIFLSNWIRLNVALAVFNMLPIAPLDGSMVVDPFVPRSLRSAWDSYLSLGPIVLVLLLIVLPTFGFTVVRYLSDLSSALDLGPG